MSQPNVGWVNDSVTQQIQEQNPKYNGGVEMSGYATITQSCMLNTIPAHWVNSTLGHICHKITDGSHNPPKPSASGLPMLNAKNIHSGKIDFSNDYRLIYQDSFGLENKRTRISPDDVLLTIVATLGRTALVRDYLPKFTLQRSVAVLSAPNIFPEYFRYALEDPNFQKQILDNAKGTAQKGIYLNKLKELEIKIPPLEEQQQIAAKLDELLAQVDTLKTRLDTIPKILKRFRQSVLAAAVSGKLTEEWKGSNNASEWEDIKLEDVLEDKRDGIRRGHVW